MDALLAIIMVVTIGGIPFTTLAASRFETFEAWPPIHVSGNASSVPRGLTPAQVKKIYNLPAEGGRGTIAIIVAYDDPKIINDLAAFSRQFGLPACPTNNNCFRKHKMTAQLGSSQGWALETTMDVEWAHAIAPGAKILLVEARSGRGRDLLRAVDYARSQPGITAVSMSWGGPEFPDETNLESHFVALGVTFFASAGDSGTGVNWPSASANVVAVGGTTLKLASNGAFISETAWPGSGGGVSRYIPSPQYQADYKISQTHGKRAVPDVSYNADSDSGYAVYDSFGYHNQRGWFTVGGTSAGAPQWAAIKALGQSAENPHFYKDKAGNSHDLFFRDIISGHNGACVFYCTARKRYDYVTGLGSPLTIRF